MSPPVLTVPLTAGPGPRPALARDQRLLGRHVHGEARRQRPQHVRRLPAAAFRQTPCSLCAGCDAAHTLSWRAPCACREGRKHKFDGTLAYAFAKRAQVVITEQQAEKLAPLGICVHSMHPGAWRPGGRVSLLVISPHALPPGWSDTPGVQESIPEFRERQKDELRSIAEGADTILWLVRCARAPLAEGLSAVPSRERHVVCVCVCACMQAMAPEGGDPARSGHFWFDRAVARTAMPMSGTEPSSADRAKLWAFLEKHYGPFEVPAAPEGATAASAGAAASAE